MLSLSSLPADVLWSSFVTHSMRDKRTPKDVCGEASPFLVTLFTEEHWRSWTSPTQGLELRPPDVIQGISLPRKTGSA